MKEIFAGKRKSIIFSSYTAIGLENWYIGSIFAALYSSLLNSESRNKKQKVEVRRNSQDDKPIFRTLEKSIELHIIQQ